MPADEVIRRGVAAYRLAAARLIAATRVQAAEPVSWSEMSARARALGDAHRVVAAAAPELIPLLENEGQRRRQGVHSPDATLAVDRMTTFLTRPRSGAA